MNWSEEMVVEERKEEEEEGALVEKVFWARKLGPGLGNVIPRKLKHIYCRLSKHYGQEKTVH